VEGKDRGEIFGEFGAAYVVLVLGTHTLIAWARPLLVPTIHFMLGMKRNGVNVRRLACETFGRTS
jgi:hypothetical protein